MSDYGPNLRLVSSEEDSPGASREPSDEALMLRAASGERQAFTQLVRRYEQAIRRFCRALVQDPSSAEDMAQDTFLNIWRGRQHYRPTSTFRAFVFTAAKNRCRSFLRQRFVRSIVGLDQGQLDELLAEGEARGQPDELTIQGQTRAVLGQAILRLPEKFRAPLILRFVDELSYDEIAAVIERTPSTARSRVHYGVTQSDVRRLEAHLRTAATIARDRSRLIGGGLILLGGALGANAVYQGTGTGTGTEQPGVSTLTWAVTGLTLGIGGIVALLTTQPSETLYRKFHKLDFSTESERATSLIAMERRWYNRIQSDAAWRRRGGHVAWVSGVLFAGWGLVGLAKNDCKQRGSQLAVEKMVLGTVFVFSGLRQLFWHRTPAERAWELYLSERQVAPAAPTAEPERQSSWQLAPMSVGTQGFGLSFSTSF